VGENWRMRAALAVTVPLALVAAGTAAGAVSPVQSSHATVSLFSTSDGTPLFSSTGLTPGDPQSACVDVSVQNMGSSDAIAVVAENVTGALAPLLDVEVDAGPVNGGSCGAFSAPAVFIGTLSTLAAVPGDGVSLSWNPSTTASWRFRITVEPENSAGFGQTATASFTWRLTGDSAADLTPPAATPTPTPTVTTSTTPTPSPSPTHKKGTAHPTGPSPSGSANPSASPSANPSASPSDTSAGSSSVSPGTGLTGSTGTGGTGTGRTSASPSPSASPSTSGNHTGGRHLPPSTISGTGGTGGTGPGSGGTPGVRHVTLQGTSSIQQAAQQALTVVRTLGAVSKDVLTQPQYPLALVALAFLFVLVQGQVDRRDPKLALAPVRDPDLRFGALATEVTP
jgi:hypothetical protein